MLSETAAMYEKIADRLERAAAHCRVAARHFRDREIPRGAAHGLAAYGDLVEARALFDDVARVHAEQSTTDV